MKQSKYNYYIPFNKGKTLIFNGYTKKFMVLPNNQSKRFIEILSSPDNISDENLKTNLKHAGFIVENKTIEQIMIVKRRELELNLPYYTLMLLPTYDCNFSCWYCLQKHEELHYSQEVIERIKKHINSYIKQNGITIFELAWFGGEPLLSINNILEIAKYSKELCQKNNTKYFNSITSNGFHFTDNIIDEFKALNFNSFQITIDGCKFDHDTVKFDRNSKSSAFEKTISNVKKLIRNIPDSRIMLRFNYSDKNIKPEDIINDLNKYLTIEERFRIEILFQKVWQVSVKDIIHSKIYLLKREFIRNGYKLANKEWLNSFGCYVERKHFNSILPNGNVVKCNNCELKTKLADINNDGVITFNVNSEYNLFNECFDCKHLPICFGCCPEHRLDYQIFKEKICNNNQYHISSIIDFCENIILNKSNEQI